MTIEEFFGTLQESITAEWRKHLQTNKYSKHVALDDFYKSMPEKVDALIEAYQADNDIVKDYKCILKDDMDAIEYLQELKKITKEGRRLLKSSELESLTDDILSLIDSTLYKLKHLKENMSLSSYLQEKLGDGLANMLTEASSTWNDVVGIVQAAIDGASPAEKNKWGSMLAIFQDSLDLNNLQKLIKKNKPTPIKRNDEDNHSPWVGFKTEKKEVIEIEFCDGATAVKLHRGNAEMTTHKDFYAGEGFLWSNAPGERCSVYECPADVVKQIIDIAKPKF